MTLLPFGIYEISEQSGLLQLNKENEEIDRWKKIFNHLIVNNISVLFLARTFLYEDQFNFQVEAWLMRLLNSMCSTIMYEMCESVSSYEEKPRDQWLFDFPAQVALCGTQIWWTTEVNISFARLEEGYENALKDYSKKQV